jgi:hypothetical protein
MPAVKAYLRLSSLEGDYLDSSPTGTVAERVTWHLNNLRVEWAKIVHFQRAIGLEAAHFSPREHFEQILVISGALNRDLLAKDNTVLVDKWGRYTTVLRALSFDVDPFTFGERCTKCYELVLEMNGKPGVDFDTELIRLDDRNRARLVGF